MNKMFVALVVLATGILSDSMFIVEQIEHAVIVRFGEPVRVIKTQDEVGLNFKLPFVENVYFFEKRLLNVELSAIEVTLGDKRRVVVDAFCRYKIVDPLKFFQAVRTEEGAYRCFLPIVRGSLVSILGNLQLNYLLSEGRSDVIKKIRNEVNASASNLGVLVVDVRIKKVDLPWQNSEAISKRMISEREKEAKELRAKGFEMAKIIQSTADKENSIAINEATKKAKIIVSEGEAEANKIYIEAFSKDEEFFNFVQTLEAYKNSISKNDTSFVVDDAGFYNMISDGR